MSDQQPSDYSEVPDQDYSAYQTEDEERAQRRRENKTFKRLVVFCDGTGQQTDAPTDPPKRPNKYTGKAADPTVIDWDDWIPASNVTRLSRIVRDAEVLPGGKEIEQICLYQNGVATGALGWVGATVNGAFGIGLNENICEAYIWLCMNWIPGDEIFLFGFSRGAFTARALAGVIGAMGLLPRASLGAFQTIYSLYSKRGEGDANKKQWDEWAHPDANNVGTDARAPGQVKIKAIGVWDTVKSLGIPPVDIVKTWGYNKKHLFHDEHLGGHIEHAFHALALDEFRLSFTPTLWFLPADNHIKTNLSQVWFPGSHSDVGGSYSDARPFDSSDLSLLWMINQVKPLLSINVEILYSGFTPEGEKSYDGINWTAAQPIHNSMTGAFAAGKHTIRTPGKYTKMEDVDKPTDHVGPQMEKVHWSVRLRAIKAKKQGVRTTQKVVGGGLVTSGELQFNEYGCPVWELDKEYKCDALAEFEWKQEPKIGWAWVKREAGNKTIVLKEEPLSETDLVFLGDSDEAKELQNPADSNGLKLHKAPATWWHTIRG